MKKLIWFIFFIWLTPVHAQWTIGSRGLQIGSTPSTVMIQDTGVTPCQGNTATTVNSEACSLGTVPAGDTIICAAELGDNGVATQFSDNINGVYDVDVYGVTNSGYHEFLPIFSSPITGAGTTTVTANFSIGVDASGFSCAAYKHGATSNVIDPNFFGYNDGTAGTSATATLTTSPTPKNNGELVYCALSPATPSDVVTAGNGNYTIVEGNNTNSIWPMVWGQTTATATNCPYNISPADGSTNAGIAFLSSTGTGGIRPYQGMILTFAQLTNGSVPTTTQLSQSISGGNPSWWGPELDWFQNAFFTISNTHTDITGSTSGPSALLSSTLYIPAQIFATADSATYTSWTTYNGNSPENLELTTGNIGDGVQWNILPAATNLSFGYYLQWDIPNTDSNTHEYGLGGIITGHASTLGVELTPTGTVMDVNMTGGTGSSTVLLGVGNTSTTYWVTGNWIQGGTLAESFYSGCPGACSLVGSNTIVDTLNIFPAIEFKLGQTSGTPATGDHIWWRNFKMCPNATYPCLP